MKALALVIGAVLFFSLRAMSAEVGEVNKTDCPFIDQANRQAKAEAPVETESVQTATGQGISK